MRALQLSIIFLLASSMSGFLEAAMHFTIRGSANQNNLGLANQNAKSASLSVASDVGKYLRLGITHRQSLIALEGYRLREISQQYSYVEERTRSISNSIDLTVVLYYGSTFTPYVQIGIVKKDYKVSSYISEDSTTISNSFSQALVPNAGLGLSVRLDANFSLNFSYVVSPGLRQITPDADPESVLDSYTSIGISYEL